MFKQATNYSGFQRPSSLPSYAPLRLLASKVSAGQSRFASPAQDYDDGVLDLNKRFITNYPSTFLMPVQGRSMVDAGIMPGTTLIIDASLKPKHGDIVVVEVEGERLVKRLDKRSVPPMLLSENKEEAANNPPIVYREDDEWFLFGVVTTGFNEY